MHQEAQTAKACACFEVYGKQPRREAFARRKAIAGQRSREARETQLLGLLPRRPRRSAKPPHSSRSKQPLACGTFFCLEQKAFRVKHPLLASSGREGLALCDFFCRKAVFHVKHSFAMQIGTSITWAFSLVGTKRPLFHVKRRIIGENLAFLAIFC